MALLSFALISWGISEIADRLSLPSLAIAIASFLVLERVVGEGILEPLLRDHRRAALMTVVSKVHETLHDVDVSLSSVKRAHERLIRRDAPGVDGEPTH